MDTNRFEAEEIRFERERAIFEEIQKNPDLHHNALVKRIVPKFMAKTTFEKTKNQMLEKNVLSVTRDGNKKFYSITENYPKKSLQLIERITHENYQSLQQELKRIKEDYNHKDINEKISKCIHLFRELLYTDNGFTFLDATKSPKITLYKDEHQSIQQMISNIFKMMSDDKDNKLIVPTIMSNVEFVGSKF